MNPINDEMATKDLSVDPNQLALNESTELSPASNKSSEENKIRENIDANDRHTENKGKDDVEVVNKAEEKKIDDSVMNMQESKESQTCPDNKNIKTLNKANSESKVNENPKADIESDQKTNEESHDAATEVSNVKEHAPEKVAGDAENNHKTNEEFQGATEDANEKVCNITENASEEIEDAENDRKTKEENRSANEKECNVTETPSEEDIEDYEDVEIPGEEEVDEIIVPDEAEAEDLTDGKDNEEDIFDKSLHEEDVEDEEEEETTKDSEIEENEINEEECSKSSEAVENDENSDKKSLNTDTKEDTSSKDYDESDVESSPIESELVALDEGIANADSTSEEPKSNEPNIDEDTASQATYDPLNCTDNKEPEAEDAEASKNENSLGSQDLENDDNDVIYAAEDDEVQFVETRNSPICIESDEDDVNSKDTTETSVTSNSKKNENNKRFITTATATVVVPRDITVTRTSARKSTAKPQQKQTPASNSSNTTLQIGNKYKSFNYLQKATIYNKRTFFKGTSTQKIVDCIELLDSSDEESTTPSREMLTQQKKTPQKRTLLGAKGSYSKTNNKNTTTVPNRLPHNFTAQVRQQPKKPAPPPLPPPTPQSNFLNAVQLQPASVSGPNPPAFSALLSNKSVIIPNAFYGNPPSIRGSPDSELELRNIRWLDSFLHQFCKPQFVPTHSCFVFLQRALKYKDFVRIKSLRTNMNSHAQSSSAQLNTQLLADLKTIFLKNSRRITNYGRRFCELTCSAVPGKTVALMAHAISGKVTLKTCNMDLPKPTNTAISSASTPSCSGSNSLTRKRQLDADEDDEYTPDKSKFKTKGKSSSENGDEDSSEMGDDRKRSLRTKRTKRLDNSFSYNEDDLLAEYEIDDEDDEKLAQMEIQRKIEKKRLEAQQHRQQQVKSFESAFIQAFARSTDEPPTTSSKTSKTSKQASLQRVRLKNTTTATVTSIRQYTATNDAEDLLQATWIENHENDDAQIISDDDEPKEHRIYKQQKKQQQHQQQQKLQPQEHYSPPAKLSKFKANASAKMSGRVSKRIQEEIITGDDDCDENNYYANNSANEEPSYWPKNIDSQMSVNGKYKDRCVICNLSCQRLVHHYVNEHRGCEVYNSRLSLSQLKLLKQSSSTASNVSLYKNGQFQYEAFCIFCQKKSRFMFPYWYQHFTMHTGEYAYRCLGCGIRKPTRSLLTQHQAQGCPEVGGVAQDYAHDSKSLQIEAKICNLCNYVQLHRSNIVKHLHTQHNIKQILPKHIQTIVLMKTTTLTPSSPSTSTSQTGTTAAHSKRSNSRHSSSHATSNTYIIDDDDNDHDAYEEILPEESQPQTNTENNYYNYVPLYMQSAFNSDNIIYENVDAGDDLSFMICGMLDVQMNPDAN